MYACKIQKWKFVSVFNTAYHAGSRKACHKVCSNVIIDRFFALNCKKDQNNTETLSEWTSFGAVKTLQRQESTIPFKMYYGLLSRVPGIRNVFCFFIVKSTMQNYFHNVQVPCYCSLKCHHIRTTFFVSLFSLEVKLLWRYAFARGKGLGR